MRDWLNQESVIDRLITEAKRKIRNKFFPELNRETEKTIRKAATEGLYRVRQQMNKHYTLEELGRIYKQALMREKK